jgi:hypothetical protein
MNVYSQYGVTGNTELESRVSCDSLLDTKGKPQQQAE